MHETLLLIEDDDAIAEALQLHLAQAGYAVQRERDGAAALRAVRTPHAGAPRWDLVLLDLMLPGADGWDICRALREHDVRMPLLMLSARSTEAHRVLGLELGADDYLAKPFSMPELLARVRALLRRAQLQAAPDHAGETLCFGPFALHRARRELQRGDERIALTLREFDLLHFLARHPGVSFSRSELLARVWGAGFDGYEHTVNSHINRLRQKIEDDPRDPQRIVTLWGTGYRFEAR